MFLKIGLPSRAGALVSAAITVSSSGHHQSESPITAASRNLSSDHRLIGQAVLLSPYYAAQRGLTHRQAPSHPATYRAGAVRSAPKQQADAAAETRPWTHHRSTMAAVDIQHCDATRTFTEPVNVFARQWAVLHKQWTCAFKLTATALF